MGPKGHVQVIIPYLTQSYSTQKGFKWGISNFVKKKKNSTKKKDLEINAVAICTIKYFPNLIEHCIEWARDFAFGGLLINYPMKWLQLLEEENFLEKLTQPQAGGIDVEVQKYFFFQLGDSIFFF